MRINRAELKLNARQAISKSKPSPFLVTIVYLLIVWVLNILSQKVTGVTVTEAQLQRVIETGDMGPLMSAMAQQLRPMGTVIGAAIEIMAMMLGVGYTLFALNVSRLKSATYGNMFDGFGLFFKVLWLYILMEIYVFLWSLLLVVPGIIAAYRYRQAIYILLDNPEMRANQCIKASKEMMRGHKWELFVLDLSFIGWIFLSVIPIARIWVEPYMETTYACYYNKLSGTEIVNETLPTYGEDDGNGDYRPPWER